MLDRLISSVCIISAATLILAACTSLPPGAQVQGAVPGQPAQEQSAGTNAVGEACHAAPIDRPLGTEFEHGFDLYCGTWQQPSGRILESGEDKTAQDLGALARTSAWRTGVDERYACGDPQPSHLLGSAPTVVLDCTQRSGGWPHVAMVASTGGKLYWLDGVPSATPALATAVAQLSGQAPPSRSEQRSTEAQINAIISAKPFSSGDLSDYYNLKRLGEQANDEGQFPEAEQAYRAALAIQQRILGPDNVALAMPMMNEALQISNQGRYPEATALFARAGQLLAREPEPTEAASLELYLAEHAANQQHFDEAKQRAARAHAEFAALLPPDIARLAERNEGAGLSRGAVRRASVQEVAEGLLLGPEERSATVGLASTLWFESALAYRDKDYDGAATRAGQARSLLKEAGLSPPGVVPRAFEISGLTSAATGNATAGEAQLDTVAQMFERTQAAKRRAAMSRFLAGRVAAEHGDRDTALKEFRLGAQMLRDTHAALPAGQVGHYLDTLAGAQLSDPAIAAEMFDAFQLIETDATARVLAEAFARLSARETKSQGALRSLQDAQEDLDHLTAAADTEEAKPETLRDKAAIDRLNKQIADAQAREKDAEAAVMAAAPEYAQIVRTNAPAPAVQALLKPDEGLIQFEIDESGSYAVLLTHSSVLAYRITSNAATLRDQILALRKTIEIPHDSQTREPPPFDVGGAHALYASLLGPADATIGSLKRLIVVPSGPLTALPLEVLVTGDAAPITDGDYSKVPFLVEKLAVTYIPSAQNFVILRKDTKPSVASESYLGFGDFVPASDQQLARSFPPDRCAADLAGLEALPPLPGTKREVTSVAQRVFNAPASDVILGSAFTKDRIAGTDLRRYRVIHLATHGLLPTDLACLPEPSIVLSVPPNAPDADAGFLRFADILSTKLDADLVILSACNTAPAGRNTHDSLSALARGFFYAGSRGLLVTHWELSDVSGPLLTYFMLRRDQQLRDSAEALRQAKLTLIHEVPKQVKDHKGFYTHPYAWAPFVLIGEGSGGIPPSS